MHVNGGHLLLCTCCQALHYNATAPNTQSALQNDAPLPTRPGVDLTRAASRRQVESRHSTARLLSGAPTSTCCHQGAPLQCGCPEHPDRDTRPW